MGKRAIAHNKSPHGFASPELRRFDPACSLGKPVSSIRLATLPSAAVSKFGSCPSRFCNQEMTDAGGAPERGGADNLKDQICSHLVLLVRLIRITPHFLQPESRYIIW